MRKADIEKHVAAFYDERLPYHNFKHVMRAVLAGEDIMQKCREEGISFAEDAVYYAILLHDAGFHEDHKAMGFESKEAYSAEIAREFLGRMSVSQSIIDKVVSAILSTHVNGSCHTIEDKIVKMADISGMASDYEQFRSDTVSLKQELEMLSGRFITWAEWKQQATEKINLFLREDLGLTEKDYDEDGKPVFHDRVRRNLERMMADETLDRK